MLDNRLPAPPFATINGYLSLIPYIHTSRLAWLQHTPTLIEAYTAKAKILKHAGEGCCLHTPRAAALPCVQQLAVSKQPAALSTQLSCLN